MPALNHDNEDRDRGDDERDWLGQGGDDTEGQVYIRFQRPDVP